MKHPHKKQLISLLCDSTMESTLQHRLYERAIKEGVPFFNFSEWIQASLAKELQKYRSSNGLLQGKQ
jgi:hypothetical protein